MKTSRENVEQRLTKGRIITNVRITSLLEPDKTLECDANYISARSYRGGYDVADEGSS